jgi:alpha-tubulin suppressor-like RCC1 family protein
MAAGSVECWGENVSGQLGNGTTAWSSIPVPVTGITNAVQLALGKDTTGPVAGDQSAQSCALLADGTVDCWGALALPLPDGSTFSTIPVPVPGVSHAVQISAGHAHVCALLEGGSIDCWGSNGLGELGDGSFNSSDPPEPVQGITNAVEVSAGAGFTCALLADGTVDCWGYNNEGEVGLGNTATEWVTTPTPLPAISGATQVSAGTESACALLADGTVDCWGDDFYGELGSIRSTYGPGPVPGVTNAVQIGAGAFDSCARIADGTVHCWGANGRKQLGRASSSSTPLPVTGLTGATQLSTGDYHACVLMSGGGIKCWGDNFEGRLGNGSTISSSTPVVVV